MADFCKQCSIYEFGEDFGELAHIAAPGKTVNLLCEGCGYTAINYDGECVYSKCERKHRTN